MAYLLFFAASVACIRRWAALGSLAAILLIAMQIMAVIVMDAMSTNPVFLEGEDAIGGDASTRWIMEEVEWEEVSGVLERARAGVMSQGGLGNR